VVNFLPPHEKFIKRQVHYFNLTLSIYFKLKTGTCTLVAEFKGFLLRRRIGWVFPLQEFMNEIPICLKLIDIETYMSYK
jgi:hypothetical protein